MKASDNRFNAKTRNRRSHRNLRDVTSPLQRTVSQFIMDFIAQFMLVSSSSKDPILQRTLEQISRCSGVEALVNVPKFVSQDASSKWSFAQSTFSCSTLHLSWRVGNLNMDTLSVISVEHDIQKYFCRTGRQRSPLSDLLADTKMLRLSQPRWALGREASHQHQSDGPPKSLLRPCGPFWTRGVA